MMTWLPSRRADAVRPHTDFGEVGFGKRIRVRTRCGMIALDGEREVVFGEKDRVEIGPPEDGPWVIDVHADAERGGERVIP